MKHTWIKYHAPEDLELETVIWCKECGRHRVEVGDDSKCEDMSFTLHELLQAAKSLEIGREQTEYGRGVCELIARALLDMRGIGEGTGENASLIAKELETFDHWAWKPALPRYKCIHLPTGETSEHEYTIELANAERQVGRTGNLDDAIERWNKLGADRWKYERIS